MPSNLLPDDRDILIRTVMGEAANQPDIGQAAVAHVIQNRVASGQWGDTPTKVVMAKSQFEPWSTRADELRGYDPKSAAYQRTAAIIDDVLAGKTPDPTGGATHFLQEDIVRKRRGGTLPKWAQGDGLRIGAHTFYNPDGVKPTAFAPETETPDLLGAFIRKPASAPLQVTVTPKGAEPPAAEDVDFLSTLSKKFNPPPPAGAPEPSATPPPATAPEWWQGQNADTYGGMAARLGIGAVRGGKDVIDTLAHGLASVTSSGANKLADFGVISPETAKSVATSKENAIAADAQGQQQFTKEYGDSGAAEVGRVGGQIAATVPMLATGGGILGAATKGAPVIEAIAARPVISAAIKGAGAGAGASALTSSASEQPLTEQMAMGAGTGAILGPLGHGATRLGAKVFGAGADRASAQLAKTAREDYGIPITAGQISSNPTVRFLDSVLQRLPFTGYGERTANQQGAFNRAVSQTFGEDVEKLSPDIMKGAQKRIGKVFEDVATRTGEIHIDRPFINAITTLLTDAKSVLAESEMKPLQNQVQNIISKVGRNSMALDAEAYQALTRKGSPLDRAMKSNDTNIRHYAGEIRSALDDVMQRSAPADAVQDLIRARSQYKALKTVEPLVRKSTTGDISPNNLINHVAKSYSGDGGSLGEVGRIGRRFIAEPPSSGTAERSAILQHLVPAATGLLGAGTVGAATYFDPESYQRNAAIGLGSLLAARYGSAALRSNALANTVINRGLRSGAPGRFQNTLDSMLPALPAAGAIVAARPTAPSR